MIYNLGRSIIIQLLPMVINMLLGWVVIFVLIGNSLEQIGSILRAKNEEKERDSEQTLEAPTVCNEAVDANQ